MVGVVVGSNDTAEHQDNVNDGWTVVKGIEAFGTYSACLIEVMCHCSSILIIMHSC